MTALGDLEIRAEHRGLIWRFAVIILVPLGVWVHDAVLYEYVPDTSSDLTYDVRHNRFTGDTCLRFRDRVPPRRLADLAC